MGRVARFPGGPGRDWLVLGLVWICTILLWGIGATCGAGCTLRPPLEPLPVSADACADACAQRERLGCGGPTCADTCRRYETEARASAAPELAWNPECQRRAPSCEEADACRGK